VCEAARRVGGAAEGVELRKLYAERVAGSVYSKVGITGFHLRKTVSSKKEVRTEIEESGGTGIQSSPICHLK
jgi:hypothetical protein